MEMKKTALLGMMMLSHGAGADEMSFKDTQSLLEGENVQSFQVIDINGDNRKDLVWITQTGDVKYRLRTNEAKATLDNLPGTRWRMIYDNDDQKFIDFTTDGGIITTGSNSVYKINQLMMAENNSFSFCTDSLTGLNRDRCLWVYTVTDIQSNTLIGVDEKTGHSWVAYKLVK